jgi:hypothetical protein
MRALSARVGLDQCHTNASFISGEYPESMASIAQNEKNNFCGNFKVKTLMASYP